MAEPDREGRAPLSAWLVVRGPSGKVCFEIDPARCLVRVRHGKDSYGRPVEDILDLSAFGLSYGALEKPLTTANERAILDSAG